MDIKKYFLSTTFKDSRDRMVYYDHFTKKAYRVPKDVEAMFKTFQGRGLYSLAIFFLLYSNELSMLKATLISLLFFAGANAYFYLKMLPTYNEAHNFDLVAEQESLKKESSVTRYIITVLYITSIGLIIYLGVTEKDPIMIIVGALYSIYATFKIIQSLIIIKKD